MLRNTRIDVPGQDPNDQEDYTEIALRGWDNNGIPNS